MKSGTSTAGARAAGSHTAALAGSDEAVAALFHQAGVLRARTLEELIDAAALLSTQPLPLGRRVAILTNAGGLGILCADACETAGLELSELTPETNATLAELLPAEASLANPVDMLGSATAASYEAVAPGRPRGSGGRLGDRPLRAAGAGGRGRRRSGALADARSRLDRQAGARGDPLRGRRSLGPPHDPRAGRALHVSRVRSACSRPRRRARGVAAQARGRRPLRRRHRHRCGRARGHPSARERGGRLAHAGADAERSWRATACRSSRNGSQRASRPPSKLLGSSDFRSSSSPESRARTRPRPAASRSAWPTRTPSARRLSASGRRSSSSRWSRPESSCSPASSRTRPSALWSRSARAESSRS